MNIPPCFITTSVLCTFTSYKLLRTLLPSPRGLLNFILTWLTLRLIRLLRTGVEGRREVGAVYRGIKRVPLFLFVDQGFERRPCYGNNS